MMMGSKTIRVLITVLLGILGIEIGAEDAHHISETKEFFDWFMNEGIYSPELSDEDTRRIISVGIQSENSEIVSQTVFTLVVFSFAHEVKGYPDYQPSSPALDRGSLNVPGLKSFLINYWRTQVSSMQDDPLLRQAWEGVPRALAFIFPRDADVLDIIWEIAATRQDGTYALELMNLGQFNTPEVNRHRIENLFIEYGPRGGRHLKLAAWGLNVHQSREGLDALIQRLGGEYHKDLHFVVDAIGAHGSEALLYFDQLRNLESKLQDLGDSDQLDYKLDQLLIILETLESAENYE